MRVFQFGFSLVLSVGLMGCAGKNSLVGSWEAEGVGPNGIKGTMVTFNANHTFDIQRTFAGRDLKTTGDYELVGNKLTMRPKTMTGLSDKMQKRNDERLAKNPPAEVSTVEWKSASEIVMNSTTGRSILRKRN